MVLKALVVLPNKPYTLEIQSGLPTAGTYSKYTDVVAVLLATWMSGGGKSFAMQLAVQLSCVTLTDSMQPSAMITKRRCGENNIATPAVSSMHGVANRISKAWQGGRHAASAAVK
jgi:hypothetical protein